MSKITQEKKEKKEKKAAGKKLPEKAAAESPKEEVPATLCCKCRYHDSKPSYCRKHKKYVARKTVACPDAK